MSKQVSYWGYIVAWDQLRQLWPQIIGPSWQRGKHG